MFILFFFVFLFASFVKTQNDEMKVVDDEKYKELFEWASKEGAEFDSIELRQSRANMRGVFATRDITKGEFLLFVPDHLLLTLD